MKFKKVLKMVLIILATISSTVFVFTTKGNHFETLTIALLYSIFMEVMLPDKED